MKPLQVMQKSNTYLQENEKNMDASSFSWPTQNIFPELCHAIVFTSVNVSPLFFISFYDTHFSTPLHKSRFIGNLYKSNQQKFTYSEGFGK